MLRPKQNVMISSCHQRRCETGHLHVDTRLGTDGLLKQFWAEESQSMCLLTQLTVSESPLFDPLLLISRYQWLSKRAPNQPHQQHLETYQKYTFLNATWNLNQKLWGWDPAICFNKFSTLLKFEKSCSICFGEVSTLKLHIYLFQKKSVKTDEVIQHYVFWNLISIAHEKSPSDSQKSRII